MPSLMPQVWKLEVFSTPQLHILVLIRGSIKENLLLSRFRKSRQLWLVTQLEKLHGSDGCQALRSRLTVLPLCQDIVHGALLQFHLLIWIILTPSSLTDGFSQIIPLGMQHTLLLGTNFAPLLQAPRSFHTLGSLGPKSNAASHLFLRLPSVFLSTLSPRHQTSLVSRHATNCLCTSVISTPSPRPRTSPLRRYGSPFKNYRPPLTTKPKLPTIHILSRTLSVLRVISTFLHSLSAK